MKRLAGNLYRYDISVREKGYERGGNVVPVHGDTTALLNSSCRHILLLVHGFNDSLDDAKAAYKSALANYIPDLLKRGLYPDAIVCFQWPGDVAVGPVKAMDAFGYPWDIEQARYSAQQLAPFLTSLCRARDLNFKISIVAHSMGCRLVLELLKIALPQVASAFNVVGLMAAAIPVDLVEASSIHYGAASLYGTDQFPRKIIKFYSTTDMVLALAFPAGQSLAFTLGIEPGEFLEAVGHSGNPQAFGITHNPSTKDSHGEYWGDQAVEGAIIAAFNPAKPVQKPVRQISARDLPVNNMIVSRNLPCPRSLV